MQDLEELEKQIAVAATESAPRKRPGEAAVPKDEAAKPPPVLFEVHIDLPKQAGSIRIDGREFQHGGTYKVREAQLATIQEIMFRAWSHYKEVKGDKEPMLASSQLRSNLVRG